MEQTNEARINLNYERVLERMAMAAKRSGRQAEEVGLVVVTKSHPVETIRAAINVGARNFGENYLQEAQEKISTLAGESELIWHMIGHIQSRKAPLVGKYFDWIHSIDSIKVARKLSQSLVSSGRELPVLIECNTSGEQSKFGFPAWERKQWDNLEIQVGQIIALPGIKLQGLMTMAPLFKDAESARPIFCRLRELRDHLAGCFPHLRLDQLSMGMSDDFEVAIEEGATMVRIGTAILGARHE